LYEATTVNVQAEYWLTSLAPRQLRRPLLCWQFGGVTVRSCGRVLPDDGMSLFDPVRREINECH
jgi:hypothetical protein